MWWFVKDHGGSLYQLMNTDWLIKAMTVWSQLLKDHGEPPPDVILGSEIYVGGGDEYTDCSKTDVSSVFWRDVLPHHLCVI